MKKIFLAFCLLIICSCSEQVVKQQEYPRIDREHADIILFETPNFTFQYPSSATIKINPTDKEEQVWFTMSYPAYGASIYCSYMPITGGDLEGALEDSYRLAYSHANKADNINQSLFNDSVHHTYGIIYDINGEVAVPIQFFVTDSVSNFLRGSFYYDNKVNVDSVRSVTEYVREDIVRIIRTLKWH